MAFEFLIRGYRAHAERLHSQGRSISELGDPSSRSDREAWLSSRMVCFWAVSVWEAILAASGTKTWHV